MSKTRLEAFSDGVLAIIITIMVFEMKAPHSAELSALVPFVSFRTYEAGEVVIEKDDDGDAFFILYSGEVEVTKPGFLKSRFEGRA